MNECHTIKFIQDISELRNIGFKEIPAGRYIKKQVFYQDTCSVRCADRSMVPDFRPFNVQLCPDLVLHLFCPQFHLGYRSDRS